MTAAISWTNFCREEYGTTVSLLGVASSNVADPAYPVENALDPDPSLLSLVDTTEDATSSGQYYRVAFGQERAVRVAAWLNLYLSDLSAVNLGAWARLLDASTANLESSVVFTPARLVPIPGAENYYNLFFIFAQEHPAHYVDFVVSVNALDSLRWGAGHLWAGPALMLGDGIDRNWEPRPLDDSPRSRGPSGAFSARKLPSRLRVSGGVSGIPYELAMGTPNDPAAPSFRQLALDAGASTEALLIVAGEDPATDRGAHLIQTQSLYGAFTEPPTYPKQAGDFFNTRFQFEQIR